MEALVMAIGFNKLRSPLLDLQDKITVGKLQGCRVCDVVQDHYEYLIWAEKSGLFKFTKIVTETIQEHAGYRAQQRYIEEEIKPWLEDDLVKREREMIRSILDDDVPF
jgi:hypothetical protein